MDYYIHRDEFGNLILKKIQNEYYLPSSGNADDPIVAGCARCDIDQNPCCVLVTGIWNYELVNPNDLPSGVTPPGELDILFPQFWHFAGADALGYYNNPYAPLWTLKSGVSPCEQGGSYDESDINWQLITATSWVNGAFCSAGPSFSWWEPNRSFVVEIGYYDKQSCSDSGLQCTADFLNLKVPVWVEYEPLSEEYILRGGGATFEGYCNSDGIPTPNDVIAWGSPRQLCNTAYFCNQLQETAISGVDSSGILICSWDKYYKNYVEAPSVELTGTLPSGLKIDYMRDYTPSNIDRSGPWRLTYYTQREGALDVTFPVISGKFWDVQSFWSGYYNYGYTGWECASGLPTIELSPSGHFASLNDLLEFCCNDLRFARLSGYLPEDIDLQTGSVFLTGFPADLESSHLSFWEYGDIIIDSSCKAITGVNHVEIRPNWSGYYPNDVECYGY